MKINYPNRTQQPRIASPLELGLQEPEQLVLQNGSSAYLIKQGKDEVCRIDFVVKAGSAYQEKMLVASGVSKLLKEGTSTLNSKQIADTLDFHGAYFESSISKDSAVFSLFTLSKHLDALLPLFSSLIFDASFPEHEINLYLERQKQEFLVNSEKVRFRAMLEFNKLVFGEGTAYGQIASLEDYNHMSREDVLSFYNRYYQPENVYLIVSGHITDHLLSLLESNFGHQQGGQYVASEKKAFTQPINTRQCFVKKENSMQSAIRVGTPIMNKLHPHYNQFVLLNTVLGGYFGSRLMSNLREEKGLTYGVNTFITNYEHGGYFSVSTEVNVDASELALSEICKEMELLRTEEVPNEELDLVKQYLYGTFLRNFDGAFSLAERFKSVMDFGLDLGFYQKSLEEILRTDAKQLMEMARLYLREENMIKLVVGGMDDYASFIQS